MGPLTEVLYGLLVAFGVGDAVAHFTHYKYGPTVSRTIKVLLMRFPILHIPVALLGIALILHLEGLY